MDRALFTERLRAAARRAREYAQTMIEEPLPAPLVFRLRLNSSYDGNPLVGDETLYPEDSSLPRALELSTCDEATALAELWRGGKVPEWIDVSVVDETGDATIVELLCCGRFTSDASLLYHEQEGRPPFHTVSPAFPAHYDGDGPITFSIHHRAQCWTLDDLERLRAHAAKVWSLELWGPAFDDVTITRLPDMPVEILELRGCAVYGPGLTVVERFERLRIVRVYVGESAAFELPPLARAGLDVELHRVPDALVTS